MKFMVLLPIIALCGYASGLMVETFAEGEDSKLQRLADTGQLDPGWIPFLLNADFYNIQKLTSNASIEYSDIPKFVQIGHLWIEEGSPINSANVAIHDGVHPVTIGDKKSLQNVVDKCIFHSPDDFSPLCVICKVLDAAGETIGEGFVAENVDYIGSNIVEIDVFSIPIPEDPLAPLTNDIQEVMGIEVTICRLNEGCTPGFWKNNFGAWPEPFNPGTLFEDAFMLNAAQAQVIEDFFGEDYPLGEAISAKGGGLNALVRHATAGLLSEATENLAYGLSMAQIKELIQDALDNADNNSFVETAKNIFAAANEQNCPLSADESGKTFDDEEKDGEEEGTGGKGGGKKDK